MKINKFAKRRSHQNNPVNQLKQMSSIITSNVSKSISPTEIAERNVSVVRNVQKITVPVQHIAFSAAT